MLYALRVLVKDSGGQGSMQRENPHARAAYSKADDELHFRGFLQPAGKDGSAELFDDLMCGVKPDPAAVPVRGV